MHVVLLTLLLSSFSIYRIMTGKWLTLWIFFRFWVWVDDDDNEEEERRFLLFNSCSVRRWTKRGRETKYVLRQPFTLLLSWASQANRDFFLCTSRRRKKVRSDHHHKSKRKKWRVTLCLPSFSQFSFSPSSRLLEEEKLNSSLLWDRERDHRTFFSHLFTQSMFEKMLCFESGLLSKSVRDVQLTSSYRSTLCFCLCFFLLILPIFCKISFLSLHLISPSMRLKTTKVLVFVSTDSMKEETTSKASVLCFGSLLSRVIQGIFLSGKFDRQEEDLFPGFLYFLSMSVRQTYRL